jgi:RNA polymerase sigma-70 factor (ECF subfamily)
VRNAFYSWLEKNRRDEAKVADEDMAETVASNTAAPDELLMKQIDSDALSEAIQELPVEFREALVMRELEGLSYKEMADIANLPIGTVMSRLARARRQLRQILTGRLAGKERDDLRRG